MLWKICKVKDKNIMFVGSKVPITGDEGEEKRENKNKKDETEEE